MKIKDVLVMAAIGLLGAACSDDDNKGSQWGDGVGGTKTNLDVSAYDKWTYVNLKTGETEIHSDTSEWIYTDGSVSEPEAKETIGIEWHIAIHRYEIKTNGGMVFDTEKTNMNEITELPEGDYKADENITNEDEEYAIITDMSKMMQGNVGYAKTATVNKVLCSWVKKTETGSMPPTIYEPGSGRNTFKRTWSDHRKRISANNRIGYLGVGRCQRRETIHLYFPGRLQDYPGSTVR